MKLLCLQYKNICSFEFKQKELIYTISKTSVKIQYEYLKQQKINCIDLKGNLLKNFNFKNCPDFLESIILDCNNINILNFKGTHKYLKRFSIENNDVKTIFFEDVPLNLKVSENIRDVYTSYVLLNKFLD